MALAGCVSPQPVSPPTRAERAASYYDLGIHLALEKDYAKALSAFQESVQADPLRYDAHYWAGICYYELGEYELELVEYKKCRALNPNYPPAWKALGHAHLAADDLVEARESYSRYLVWEPSDARVLFNLGLVEADLGQPGAAKALWRRCLKLDTNQQLLEEAERLLEDQLK